MSRAWTLLIVLCPACLPIAAPPVRLGVGPSGSFGVEATEDNTHVERERDRPVLVELALSPLQFSESMFFRRFDLAMGVFGAFSSSSFAAEDGWFIDVSGRPLLLPDNESQVRLEISLGAELLETEPAFRWGTRASTSLAFARFCTGRVPEPKDERGNVALRAWCHGEFALGITARIAHRWLVDRRGWVASVWLQLTLPPVVGFVVYQ